jgi:iron(III) transport system ATP-binding protein
MSALETVQMAHLADRPAPRLSGGQQQRVAIARALAGRPQALLFDEPLSNLDAKLRNEMRKELRRLQRQIGLTSVYVTHDQSEALAISDWVVVMKEGRIVERGTPTQIYRAPRHVFTAQFLGTTNLVPGKVEDSSAASGHVGVTTPLGRFVGFDPSNALKVGAPVQISIRPEDFLADGAVSESAAPLNRLDGKVEFAIFAGSVIEAEVRCGDTKIQCFLGRNSDSTPGAAVSLAFPAEACLVLPDQ